MSSAVPLLPHPMSVSPSRLIAALALGASAAAAQPASTPASTDALAAVPKLSTLIAQPRSDLADVVARYASDRRSLLQRYDAPGSPDRRARLRAFTDAWRTRLGEVDFDRLS